MGNPRTQRRIGVGVSLAGALLGGLASAVRAGLIGGGLETGTYLIDVLAVLVCLAGVVIEGRAVDVLAGFFDLRRGAVLQLIGGVFVALSACVVIPAVRSDVSSDWVASGMAALVYLGAGRGLSGAATLTIAAVPGYLERRIDDRLDEPW